MGTQKTVDQILDGAADVLEKHGWVTEVCHDSETGGHCVLGAIAAAVYPDATGEEIEERAYVDHNHEADPRHVEAVHFLSRQVAPDYRPSDERVYLFNDDLPSGRIYEEREVQDPGSGYHYRTLVATGVNDEVRMKSAETVVRKLRDAASAYREQASQ
jgi:hypothetical protein